MMTAGVMGNGAGSSAPLRGRSAGVWWWPRRRSVVLDGLLAAVSALECAAEGASFAGRDGLPVGVGAVLGLVVGATLLLRRRWPVAVVLISLAVAPAQMGGVLQAVALYTLAASDVPRRITAAVVGMTVTGTLVVAFVTMNRNMAYGGYRTPAWLVLLVSVLMAVGLTAPPVLLGLYAGARRRLVESLRERADGLERELSLLAEQAGERAERARIEERTRIAREMHDVVAHRVSLMVVHASALAAVVHNDPDRAADSAQLLGDMGRQALDELRQMLGVLRTAPAPAATARLLPVQRDEEERGTSGLPGARPSAGGATKPGGTEDSGGAGGSGGQDAGDPAGGPSSARPSEGGAGGGREGVSPDGAGTDGAHAVDTYTDGHAESTYTDSTHAEGAGARSEGDGPCLARLGVLVEQSRAAGMVVSLSEEGDRRPLAAPVERAAYRVVQEALTNVHKHAVGAKTLVRVAYRIDEIAVLVENGPPDAQSSAGLPSGGNGLLGMKERVTGLGGGFIAGATRTGGFRVSAVIPTRAA